MSVSNLSTQLKGGLDAPICLTWELTYACNLQCIHCLSSSGRRDPRELDTDQVKNVLDQLRDLQVFYINIGGGEPMIRKDFFEILEHAERNNIGVKFSTNGTYITAENAQRLAAMNYLDIQISIDGADAATMRGYIGTLLTLAQSLESQERRVRPHRNAPRTLDVDLLLAGSLVLDTPLLTLPHPRMHQRAFVLSPLLEVDPLAQIPRLGAAADWAKACAGQRIERLGPLTDAKGDAPPAGPTAFVP